MSFAEKARMIEKMTTKERAARLAAKADRRRAMEAAERETRKAGV